MIVQPIPYVVGNYAVFEDTLTVDDTTEALTLTKPDATDASVAHGSLTRVVNADTTITYSVAVLLDQAGLWKGEFTATGTNANSVPVSAYVVAWP